MITAALGVLAALQITWCFVYGTGPWRATRLGWVWLLKGSMLGLIWSLLFVDRFREVPDLVWILLAVGMIVATSAWLWATVRVRRGVEMRR